MKTISILGCGWLGMPLGAKLVSCGYSVKGSTTSSQKVLKMKENGIEPFCFLIGKDEIAQSFLETDVLIVTIPPGNVDLPEAYFGQLAQIQNQARASGIKHIIFISSTSVYPNANKVVLETDASEKALTRSGISLLKAEQLFQNVENTTIRFSGLIGPGRHPGKWFAGKKNLKGANVPVNMIHQEDCIGVIEKIIEKNAWGRTYNACAPDHPTKKEYYSKMTSHLDLPPPEWTEEPMDWKIVNSDKLVDELEYAFLRTVWEV